MQVRTKLKKFQCLNNETNKTPYGILLEWKLSISTGQKMYVLCLINIKFDWYQSACEGEVWSLPDNVNFMFL